jgi:hypothetical protein
MRADVRYGLVLMLIAALLPLGPAAAQDRRIRLNVLHEMLDRASQELLPVDEARRMLAELDRDVLDADVLKDPTRVLRWKIEVYAALSAGDIGRAQKALENWRREGTPEPLLHEATYAVAVAAGDAALAFETLPALEPRGGARQRRAWILRRSGLARVGHPAPDVIINLDNGQRVNVAGPDGIALLLDFWSTRQPPEPVQVAAVQRLANEYANNPRLRVIGINSDDEGALDAARDHARTAGLTWPQHYEGRTARAPLTRLAFDLDAVPRQVVVDGQGAIRAVGYATDRELCFAVRAAAAEARGEFAPVLPRTRDGQEFKPVHPLPPITTRPASAPAASPDDSTPPGAPAERE